MQVFGSALRRWFLALALATAALVLSALLAALYLAAAPAATYTTWYVRPDGGSTEQCTGRTDAPFPGSGTGQPCAWDHPFRALPPGGPARIAGGDTLIIASGTYTMGYGAPETVGNDACSGTWDCHMPPIPSGPDAVHPTRILGQNWNAGCGNPPELWGTERADVVIDLTGSSNVVLACLNITDHSSCAESHAQGTLAGRSQFTCERDNAPFGPWAATGIAAADAANVQLRDLDIHGLASNGILAGRLTDWLLENVRLAGNGLAGWNGDIGASANAGTLAFRRFTVEWNGCPESYPARQYDGCWAQQAGGYGDGFGTGATGGRWLIEDAVFRYNTSDGLDLLYASLPTATIEIRRTLSMGNAGDQIKFTGQAVVENSIVDSNCAFFTGQPFMLEGDNCRAGGSALAITLHPGGRVTVTNSTITGQGTALVIADCREGETCNGSEMVSLRNDIFVGQPRAGDPATNVTFAWYDDEPPLGVLPRNPFTTTYALVTDTVFFADANPCPGPFNLCDRRPGLVNTSLNAFDARLLSDSPAIDAGDNGVCPPGDYVGTARPVDGNGDGRAVCDIGAYEFTTLAAPTATATPTRTATATPTGTATPSSSTTPTPTSTATAASTPTTTAVSTPTAPDAATSTPTPGNTPAGSAMPAGTETPAATPTGTALSPTLAAGLAPRLYIAVALKSQAGGW